MTSPRHAETPAGAVEDDRVRASPLVRVSVAAVIVTVVAVSVATRILHSEAPAVRSPPARAPDQIGIVEQTLILDTRRGLDERARQRATLDSYGWIDRGHGVARIPIDRAMDLVADPALRARALGLRVGEADAGGGEGR